MVRRARWNVVNCDTLHRNIQKQPGKCDLYEGVTVLGINECKKFHIWQQRQSIVRTAQYVIDETILDEISVYE